MKLDFLKAQSFRNVENVHITFSDGVNLLYGKNGAGFIKKIEADNAMMFKLSIERDLAEKRNQEKVIQELDSQQATDNATNISQTKIENTAKSEENDSNNNVHEEVTSDTIVEDFTPKKLSDFFVP